MHVFRSRNVDIHYLFNFLLTVGLMTLKLYRIQSYDTTHEVSLSAAQATKFLQSFSMHQNERRDYDQSERNSISEPKVVNESTQPTNQRHSLDGFNVNRVNNLFIQNAPMNDKSTNLSFDGALPQGGRHSSRPVMDGYRYNAEDDAESETDVKKRLSTASSQMSRREESEGQRPHPQPVYQRQGILV